MSGVDVSDTLRRLSARASSLHSGIVAVRNECSDDAGTWMALDEVRKLSSDLELALSRAAEDIRYNNARKG